MSTSEPSELFRNKYGEFPKLTSTNYHTWSKAAESNIDAARAWKIVTGEEQPPNLPAANAGPAARDCHEDRLECYESCRAMAAATIYQSCMTVIQSYITNSKDPQSMWQNLKNHFDTAAHARGPFLIWQSFCKEQFDGTGTISEFIAKLLLY